MLGHREDVVFATFSKMRNQNYIRPLFKQKINRRQGCFNAKIIFHFAVFNRNIKIHPQKHSFPFQVFYLSNASHIFIISVNFFASKEELPGSNPSTPPFCKKSFAFFVLTEPP